ncbi:MAG: ferritin-like domain-containing protein [Deltaproteobacteria bacterium]|nr:MAG: ferritin-like domain-containing protein [Deltaproteobacteria bacterium]
MRTENSLPGMEAQAHETTARALGSPGTPLAVPSQQPDGPSLSQAASTLSFGAARRRPNANGNMAGGIHMPGDRDFVRSSLFPFPPYRLGSAAYIDEARGKFAKLERLYQIAQSRSWNGKEVLADLLKRHGGIQVEPHQRGPLARIFSLILWGELAAWMISADLAERLDDVEAKMAATSQAFDEARHFDTMRGYLLELGGEIPRLDIYTAMLLRMLIDTRSLAHKLLGMQLLAETFAIDVFRTVAERRVEPVLADLLPYFERDESRHVALGVLYLPEQLRRLSLPGVISVYAFQARIFTLTSMTQALHAPDFEALGIDSNQVARRGLKLQKEAVEQMSETRGVLTLSAPAEWITFQTLDFLFPPKGQRRSTIAEVVNTAGRMVAQAGDYALSWAA